MTIRNRRFTSINHQFVRFVPDNLAEGTVYISIEYATAAHRCFCGCGREVITPLSPTDWLLIYDGQSVSLDPSIGNWNFPCQSHYWIEENQVRWAPVWSRRQVNEGRSKDREAKTAYFQEQDRATQKEQTPLSLWKRFKDWLGSTR